MIRSAGAVVLLLLVASPSLASGAPPQLHGKSVVVRWSENRVQRIEGRAEFRSVTVPMQLAVYVSTAGRVFNAMQSSSGAHQQSPGTEVKGGRVPSFDGRQMTVMQLLLGLARRIVVDFDAGFANCSATAIVGLESGKAAGTIVAFGTGVRQEVKSASASGVSCTLKSGNVFE